MSISGGSLILGNLHKPVELQFGSGNPKLEFPFFKGRHGKRQALISDIHLRIMPNSDTEQKIVDDWKRGDPPIQWETVPKERYAAVDYLRISRPGKFSIILETGSMTAAFAAIS